MLRNLFHGVSFLLPHKTTPSSTSNQDLLAWELLVLDIYLHSTSRMGRKCYSMHRGYTHTGHPKTIKNDLYKTLFIQGDSRNTSRKRIMNVTQLSHHFVKYYGSRYFFPTTIQLVLYFTVISDGFFWIYIYSTLPMVSSEHSQKCIPVMN
jgi:hypothetical protein